MTMSREAQDRIAHAHSRNERTFDRGAGEYQTDAWFGGTSRSTHSYQITRRRLLEALSLSGTESVLDVGCGPGTWTRVMAELTSHVTALDLSQEMLNQAREFVRPYAVTFVHADILWYKSERPYDRVASVRAIEYVVDKVALAEQLARLVADDGLLVIITKNPFSPWGLRRVYWWTRWWLAKLRGGVLHLLWPRRFPSLRRHEEESPYMRRVPPHRLVRLLRRAGFDDITVSPVVVGLPIMAGTPGEVPLIPLRLVPTVLRVCDRLSNWLAGIPRPALWAALWLSESYCVRAKKCLNGDRNGPRHGD
jgi:SAM-dependent methyltransferase